MLLLRASFLFRMPAAKRLFDTTCFSIGCKAFRLAVM